MQSDIILSTLNARYLHSSLALRYLYANMGERKEQTRIMEFVIETRPIDIVESLLEKSPKIIGFGIYIWNTSETLNVISLLRQVAPEVTIILGGPEISFEIEEQQHFKLANYVIPGQADLAFAQLCNDILTGTPPLEKIIPAPVFKLDELVLPYADYNAEDIANRLIYVEASRGCPFKCEFCISSLDKTAYPFKLDDFLEEMDVLYQRGVRNFKFIDRTFNLKVETSIRILNFFLEKIRADKAKIFLHFELIPDHLPEKLKAIISAFPDHSLQFEIGIQSFNPEVQQRISRKQDNQKAEENIRWLRQSTTAHLHTDLIIGLPGENIESIAAGFNKLVSLEPHEIQVGILKRLKGTPIIRHTTEYDMRYSLQQPFEVLSTNLIDFKTMQSLKRFARYWDLVANSGRFSHALKLILGDNPFARFYQLSHWLFRSSDQTYRIALPRLFTLLHTVMIEELKIDENEVTDALLKDFEVSRLKGQPPFINKMGLKQSKRHNPVTRQQRHLNAE